MGIIIMPARRDSTGSCGRIWCWKRPAHVLSGSFRRLGPKWAHGSKMLSCLWFFT